MPSVDFNRLRHEITMEHVLELLEFECIRRRGEQWYGYCPLHESETKHRRAFSVNVARNCYYCHKCGSRGDQFKLWSEANQLPLYSATIALCERLSRDPYVHHCRTIHKQNREEAISTLPAEPKTPDYLD